MSNEITSAQWVALLALRDGWDGVGSLAPHPAALRYVARLLDERAQENTAPMHPTINLTCTGDGDVVLEWMAGPGDGIAYTMSVAGDGLVWLCCDDTAFDDDSAPQEGAGLREQEVSFDTKMLLEFIEAGNWPTMNHCVARL